MYRYKTMVTDVIDGDTVRVAIDLGFGLVYQTKVRLAGIDCAELRDKKNREKALAAKKYAEEKLLDKVVILKTLKTGKYGRYIAFLYFEGDKESFNDQMVRDGFAEPYKKSTPRPTKKKEDEPLLEA